MGDAALDDGRSRKVPHNLLFRADRVGSLPHSTRQYPGGRSGLALDRRQRWPRFLAYCTTLIDLKHAVIMDVEATTAVQQAEVTAQRRMLNPTRERFGIWPERLAADTGYGDAANLAWLVHQPASSPISRSGRKAAASMAASDAPTSATIMKRTPTPARAASS